MPVRVVAEPPKGPGDNLLPGEQVSTASTTGGFSACSAVDGITDSTLWPAQGWSNGTRGSFPDPFDVAMVAPAPIDQVVLSTLDNAAFPASRYAVSDWDVQVRSVSSGGSGGTWSTVASVRGDTAATVTTSFAPVVAEAIRIVALGSNNNDYSRIVELAAYGD